MRTIPRSLTKRPTILGVPVGRRRPDWAKIRTVGIATAAAAGAFRARHVHVPQKVRDLTGTVASQVRDLPGGVSAQVGKLTGDHRHNGADDGSSDGGAKAEKRATAETAKSKS